MIRSAAIQNGLILAIGTLLSPCSIGLAQAPEAEYAHKYEKSFVGLTEKPADWRYYGTDADKHVKFEPEGMRISLPAGYEGSRPELGVAARLGIQGDFEITLRYEILQMPETEKAGMGTTRVTLAVILAQPRNDAATVSHRIVRSGARQYHAWVNRSDEKKGPNVPATRAIAAQGQAGRLRICRAGATMFYYAAAADAKEFTLVATLPLSRDDVAEVRLVAATGWAKAVLDVRVTDLVVRADGTSVAKPPAPKFQIDAPPTKAYAQEYFQSFKSDAGPPSGWELVGRDAADCVRFEAAGLRLDLPADPNRNSAPQGLRTRFGVKGDCEITVNYEILTLPPQADAGAPVGTRLSLNVVKESPKGDQTSLSWSLSGNAGTTFTGWSMVWNEDRKKSLQQTGMTKAGKAMRGRLRFVRSGPNLYYGGADGLDADFMWFRKSSFGSEDLRHVQVTAGTGTNRAKFDVRVTDLRIRADAIPEMPLAPPPVEQGAQLVAQPTRSDKGTLTIVLIGGVAFSLALALGLGGWLFLRRRDRPAQTAFSAFLAVACPECGKKLKVKAELVGKKVKCAQCGQAVTVAHAE